MQKVYPQEYWNMKYRRGSSGWDAGNITTPLKDYFDQISRKDIKILVPGAGNAWEVEYLHNNGFTNVYLLDFADESIKNFKNRCPSFPEERVLHLDFWKHKDQYDLIVEQTFCSSFHPSTREKFFNQISTLLKKGGKYVGILFNHEFEYEEPPFGGSINEYRKLLDLNFDFLHFETAHNSIKPRKSRELFFLVRKKQ